MDRSRIIEHNQSRSDINGRDGGYRIQERDNNHQRRYQNLARSRSREQPRREEQLRVPVHPDGPASPAYPVRNPPNPNNPSINELIRKNNEREKANQSSKLTLSENVIISFEQGWNEIQPAVYSLIANIEDGIFRVSPEVYVEIYTICYNLCTQRRPHNFSAELYAGHGDLIKDYLHDFMLSDLQRMSFITLEDKSLFLERFLIRYEKFKLVNKQMKKIFSYLNQYFTKYNSLVTISERGFNIFKKDLFEINEISSKVLTSVNCLINERRGRLYGEDNKVEVRQIELLIQRFVEFMQELDSNTSGSSPYEDTVYFVNFEPALLRESEIFYESHRKMEFSAGSYMEFVVKALNVEHDFSEALLHKETTTKLMNRTKKLLFESPRMLNQCTYFLQNNMKNKLKDLFLLFGEHEQSVEPLARSFQIHICHIGKAFCNDMWNESGVNDVDFPAHIKRLYDQYTAIAKEVFGSQQVFNDAIRYACISIINLNSSGQHYSGVVFLESMSKDARENIVPFCINTLRVRTIEVHRSSTTLVAEPTRPVLMQDFLLKGNVRNGVDDWFHQVLQSFLEDENKPQ